MPVVVRGPPVVNETVGDAMMERNAKELAVALSNERGPERAAELLERAFASG